MLISVPDMPRSYVPALFALKLPELFIVLGFGGAAGALAAALRRDIDVRRRAALLVMALAALLPLALTIVLRPAMYNGIRHFLFVLPPLAVLGGIAGVFVLDVIARWSRLAAAAAVLILLIGLAVPVIRNGASASIRVCALQCARRRYA